MTQPQFQVLLVRAFKTFIQGAASVLALNVANVTDLTALKALAIAAAAAGISALMNLFVQPTEAK